jgi:GT2 family glycosyltransferase
MSDVDVIVLDVDGGAMLEECLDSIRAQSVPPARVVVFDNGSRAPVADRARGVEVIRSEINRGFAAGVNAAFAATFGTTRSDYVALVNNDVVLHPDWLGAVRDALDRDARLAAVQSIIRRPDGKIDGAGIDVSDGTFRQIGHGSTIGSPLPVAWGVSATAALYRRSALGEKMFDERFFSYYEDTELSARLRDAGWRIAVLPLVLATHRGSHSAPLLGGDALRLRTRNRYFVVRLHPTSARIGALLWEDARLLLRGRSSLRGILQGVFETMNTER